MKTYIIYGWKFPDNTIKYIGKTCRPDKRLKRYLKKANPNYIKFKSIRKIHIELRKHWHQIDSCEFVILYSNLTAEEAKLKEKDCISIYDTYNNGLNQTYWG